MGRSVGGGGGKISYAGNWWWVMFPAVGDVLVAGRWSMCGTTDWSGTGRTEMFEGAESVEEVAI